VAEPTSPAGWVAILVALLLPAVTTWAVIANTSTHRDEAEVRWHMTIQRQLDRQEREIEALQVMADGQAEELRSLDREMDQIEEAFDDPD
jgi:uncharacterized membrane protein YfbV (UPF0208 family)